MALNNDIDGDDEKPLDPVAERVRRKMVRLLAVSIGIMIVGVMAVLGVVVYKTLPGGLGSAEEASTVSLPAGEEVVDVSLDGDRALLRTTGERGVRLYLISLADGRILKRLDLAEAPSSE
ncbi:fimbrial protein [Jiella marina]|uniref:fimbrial protein n=1 Tax=Jiella sp. LLJ827 TaxID=2917712 RepID=UPI0021010FC9|nr:fimbrial protein [Jiella sp. LLJ827]MCQ0990046.1 fimbrial protein [Jiella sp. LLJ827]